jgi:hypothetical protein
MSFRTLAISAFFFVSFGSLQAQQAPNVIVVEPDGTEFFSDLLHKAGFQPLRTPREIAEDPTKTVLVIFGSTRVFEGPDANLIMDFLGRGGKILVCSDLKTDWNFENFFNIKIAGTKVRSTAADECYNGDPDLPLVKPYFNVNWERDPGSPSKLFFGPAFFNGQGKVATNVPTALKAGAPRFGPHTIEALAGFPRDTKFRLERLKFDPDQDHFAVGGRYFAGRYLIMADTDLFTNIMMVQPTQNPDFATAVVSWLREGEREPRKRCLLLDRNRPIPKFDTISGIQDAPWHVKVNYFLNRVANPMIQEMEAKNIFNQKLGATNPNTLRQIIRAMLFGLMGFVFLYGIRWMLARRHRFDHSIIEASMVVSRIPRGGALQQRHEALMDNGNLFEAFRDRIRERFDLIGGKPDSEGRMPRIEVDETLDDARQVRQRVLDLWDVAYGTKVISVQARDWDPLNTRLRGVLEDALDGRWRFEPSHTTT